MSAIYRIPIHVDIKELKSAGYSEPFFIKGKNFRFLFVPIQDRYYSHLTQLLIEATNIKRAQFICDLIVCGLNLFEGSYWHDVRDTIVAIPVDIGSDEKLLYDTHMEVELKSNSINGLQRFGITKILDFVAKASYRKIYINALIKYQLSIELYSIHWVDLDPYQGHIPLSSFTYLHLRFGYAIIIAHSIIEELGFEVRVTKNHPRSIENGKMVLQIKDDLENRLRKAKIDISENAVWHRRGSKNTIETRLEKRLSLSAVKKASWSYGNVRDFEIPLADAINEISWIRSKIASHKVDKDIRALSVYDVSNAQYLARRLFLETLGFWSK